MSQHTLAEARSAIYRLLSYLYHDEIPEAVVEKMAGKAYQEALREFLNVCSLTDLTQGLRKMGRYVQDKAPAEAYKDLSYEYADIFLNAGANPVFPYESVYVSRDPVVMGEPVFSVRRAYRKGGVHKSPAYKDVDDHIAVELEFLAYLVREGEKHPDQAPDFQKQQVDFLRDHLMGWVIEFCAVLSNSAVSAFYQGMAELTMSFLFNERMLAFDLLAGKTPSTSLSGAFHSLAGLVGLLDLDEGLVTLAHGIREETRQREIPTHCYICGALCGQTATVKDDVIVSLKGLPGDPKGGGRLCPKGAAATSQIYSAYRLKAPLIKEDGRFRKASWDEALTLVADRLMKLEHHKVGYVRGNDWNNWLHEALFEYYGAHKATHRPMCDNANRLANEHNLNDKRPWIHYEHADYIVLFGINELATGYGQRKTAMLRNALAQGAKLVVFDPRRSESAAAATEWIPLQPGTDGAVAMAICHVLVKNHLYNEEFVKEWTYGFEPFRDRLLGKEDGIPRTPEWAEEISHVPARTIERIAMELAHARHKGAISWCGVCQNPNGVQATQAVQALNGLLGTFDAPGGPSLPFKRKLKSAWGQGQEKPPANAPKEKLNRFAMWQGWAPAHFSDDVATGKIMAVINYFADPVLSWGNEEATANAFKQLDFIASIDAFMGNTTLLADVVLPVATYLEESQVKADWLYDAFISYWAEVVPPLYDSRSAWWVFINLARKMGLGHFFPWENVEEAQRNQLKDTPWSLEELKEKGYIVTDAHEFYKYRKWGGLNPPEGYGSSGNTRTGKYNFKNPLAEEKKVDSLPDHKQPDPALAPDDSYPYIFGYFRLFEHEHSSTFHNITLMKLQGTNPLWMNPVDASERGLEDGDRVTVYSPWGELTLRLRVTWDICQGVLASAGGFGHLRGIEADPKYPQFGGVNSPGISPPNITETMGGTPLLKYVKVNIKKA